MESTQARRLAESSSGTETSFFEFNTRVFRTDVVFFHSSCILLSSTHAASALFLSPLRTSNVFQWMPCFAVFNPPFNPFLLPFIVT
jgi:hypothetical protein